MIGLGLKLPWTNPFNEISQLLSQLQQRATYFENAATTSEILTDFEKCEWWVCEKEMVAESRVCKQATKRNPINYAEMGLQAAIAQRRSSMSGDETPTEGSIFFIFFNPIKRRFNDMNKTDDMFLKKRNKLLE